MISFLDILFPKRCASCGQFGDYICKDCFSKIAYLEKPVCPICQRQAIGGKTHPVCAGKYTLDGLVVVFRYRGPIKSAIQKVKYKWAYQLIKPLLNILISSLWRFEVGQERVLTPIPLHPRRQKWRGFNQAELLAKIIARTFGLTFENLLVRKTETQTQVGLTKEARRKNVRGAFILKSGAKVWGRDFLLVDDVYTSGATMKEAARVLKKAGAKSVWAMAIALG